MTATVLMSVIILELLFPVTSRAGDKDTIVVVPVHDSASDDISDDLIGPLSKALARSGISVVDANKVAAVLNYYDRTPAADGNADAERAIIEAKERYFGFENGEARALMLKGIKLLEADAANISRNGALLRDAYVTAAVIDGSKQYFIKAIRLDPSYLLDERAFPPSMVKIFNEARDEALKGPSGSIEVGSDPEVAEVFINGVQRGVTPVKIEGLPIGSYNVAIRTNRYDSVERTIDVEAGRSTKVRERLSWGAPASKQAAINDALAEIKEGVRIAELMRVQKAVLVDADAFADGSGEINLRMVDRGFRAGYAPVIVGYDRNKRGLSKEMTRATNILTRQFRSSLGSDPQRFSDQVGVGDPILLGKRHKRFGSTPAFWALLGGVLAAGAGAATAGVLLSGGGDGGGGSGSRSVDGGGGGIGALSSGNGSVNVQFK